MGVCWFKPAQQTSNYQPCIECRSGSDVVSVLSSGFSVLSTTKLDSNDDTQNSIKCQIQTVKSPQQYRVLNTREKPLQQYRV